MSNGVFETSDSGTAGVSGISENHTPQAGPGVMGQSDAAGVWGISNTWHGVVGQSHSTTGGAGVQGENVVGGPGVIGTSKTWHGTYGATESTTGGAGVCGEHKGNWAGVLGQSDNGIGVVGLSKNGEAGRFEGRVTVTGDITAHDVQLSGGDCAEEFEIAEAVEIEPGTVMVLDQEGVLQPGRHAYDKRVAGVISGAGDYKPGIVLDKQPSSWHRAPVALVGKVFCKVDAHYGPIEVGDLLTTSDMKLRTKRQLSLQGSS